MPYIPSKARRQDLSEGSETAQTPGELNFLLTYFSLLYLKEHLPSYQVMNDITGALESAKQEFYRRVVAPYEDVKRELNGDVYHP